MCQLNYISKYEHIFLWNINIKLFSRVSFNVETCINVDINHIPVTCPIKRLKIDCWYFVLTLHLLNVCIIFVVGTYCTYLYYPSNFFIKQIIFVQMVVAGFCQQTPHSIDFNALEQSGILSELCPGISHLERSWRTSHEVHFTTKIYKFAHIAMFQLRSPRTHCTPSLVHIEKYLKLNALQSFWYENRY